MLDVDLLTALDAVAFARMLGFEPGSWQVRALRWTGRRMLLNCARQAGKSTVTALIGVHRAIYYPGSLILLVSPSLRQSSELFRKCSDWLAKMAAPPALNEDNKLSATLANGSRVVSLPSSEGTIRGFSAVDLVIIDEASRVPDGLYYAVRPMLAVSNGRMLAMSTPFGKRGWWYTEYAGGGSSWERVEVPATMNPRISPAFLEEERRSLGDYWFKQEYLCDFAESIDSVFAYGDVVGALSSEVSPLFADMAVSNEDTLANNAVAVNPRPLAGG